MTRVHLIPAVQPHYPVWLVLAAVALALLAAGQRLVPQLRATLRYRQGWRVTRSKRYRDQMLTQLDATLAVRRATTFDPWFGLGGELLWDTSVGRVRRAARAR